MIGKSITIVEFKWPPRAILVAYFFVLVKMRVKEGNLGLDSYVKKSYLCHHTLEHHPPRVISSTQNKVKYPLLGFRRFGTGKYYCRFAQIVDFGESNFRSINSTLSLQPNT